MVPDAVPRYEPRSRYGNPPFYDVFGKRYFVLSSSSAYVERGVASWYGPGFHKERTSTGEPYDMYGMTAAHKTLPLPAYARVTNLQNGRSVVVRINDRGPFVANRIIDLSYSAAFRLDMLRDGTAMVEVRSIDAPTPVAQPPVLPAGPGGPLLNAAVPTALAAPTATPVAPASAATLAAAPTSSGSKGAWVSTPTPLPASAAPSAAAAALAPEPQAGTPAGPLFVQAGAFADPANAERLAAKLQSGGFDNVFVRSDTVAGRKMYRVRLGPVPSVPEFDRIVGALERSGVHDAHLALN
jgi:rare lipoprotein A